MPEDTHKTAILQGQSEEPVAEVKLTPEIIEAGNY